MSVSFHQVSVNGTHHRSPRALVKVMCYYSTASSVYEVREKTNFHPAASMDGAGTNRKRALKRDSMPPQPFPAHLYYNTLV